MKKLLITLTTMLVSIVVMAQTKSKNYVKSTTYQQPVQNEAEIEVLPTLEKIENISYYDGLGRPEQSIALRQGNTLTIQDELTYDWESGNVTTAFFNKYGSAIENEIVVGTGPYNNTDLLWRCGNDGVAGADGGWHTNSMTIDINQAYRYSVWVKRTGNITDGKVYFGTQNVNNLNGTANTNPYFWSGYLPQADTWYLLVGVIHPHSYNSGINTGESGLYDVSGNKLSNANEFTWRSNENTTLFRNFLYQSTDTGEYQYFYKPLLQRLDGQELTISQIAKDTNLKDIVTPVVYDADGRQTKEYLPYADLTVGKFTREDIALSKLNNYYSNTYSEDFNGTLNPYSEKNLETSPLARIHEQGAPGADWKVDATIDTDHTIKFEYETNATDEIAYYSVTFTSENTEIPQLQYNGSYVEEQLYKSIVKDENWSPTQTHLKDHTTEEFKNKSGQVVLKRTYNGNDTDGYDTYYIYDDFGNLTYVLSPKGAEAIKTANYIIAQNILDELCYQYKYDGRNRLIEKKIPGKGWEYIVYDKLDRPVLTQDANQRTQSPKQWLFTKYDNFGRVVYTGLHDNSGSRTNVQSTIDAQNVLSESRTVGITIIGDASAYYSNTVLPNTDIKILTVNYFDDYPKEIAAVIPNPVNFTLAGNTHTISNFTRTLATANKVRILGTNQWIISATYYDDKKRPIYSGSHNAYLNTTDIAKIALDFIGKTLETESSHTKGSNTAITIHDFFTYDHASRLLTQTQSVNNSTPELIVNNSYDELLGQLVNKKVGGAVANEPETSTGLQSVDYKYNVRGWLKQINDVENLGNDLFSFELSYNTTKTNTTPLFNGNISETISRTANDAPTTRRGYGYTYDALNRLTGAKGIVNTSGTLFTSDTHYNEDGIQYDRNGNILRLDRRQTTNNYIDKLFYNYDIGNKLLSVDDNTSGPEVLEGFKDGNTVGDDYTYDANGNMVKDLNKGIGATATNGITYNHLNLPTQVVFDNDANKSIHYLYDATGIKQAKVVADNGNYTVTYYAGNFIYESTSAGEALKFFNHPEGYAQPDNTGGFDYIYQFKDHLGNIRLSYSDSNDDNQVTGTTTQVFLDDMENSSGWDSNGALYGANAVITTTKSKSGTKSIMIDKQTTGSKFASGNNWITIDNNQATEYTYSGWVYAESNTTNNFAVPEIWLAMRTADETGYFTSYTKIRTFTKDQWVYLEETINVPANIAELFIIVKNLNGNGITWFDDIQVVRTNSIDVMEIVEENNYYPFGLKHKGYNENIGALGDHKYGFGGKEEQSELGLEWMDFHARNYDPAIARWMNLDPLAEQMRRHSPYNYAFNNPVFFIDPDGMKPFGDYYAANGEYLGNDGIDDDKAYVVTTNQATPVDGALQGGPTSTTVTELSVSNSELLLLASTAYGESSIANNSSEVSAIASAIINNKNVRGANATITNTIDGFALAATDGNERATEFNSTSVEGRNGTFMQDAVGGAINAVNGGKDLSNGATHWAGDDVDSSSEKRALGGLNVTNSSHDIHSVGSETVSNAPVTTYWKNKAGKNTRVRGTYSYTWQTTAGYGGTTPNGSTTGTTFMKKTDNFINATAAPRY